MLCTLTMTDNVDASGVARYPVGACPILDPQTGAVLVDGRVVGVWRIVGGGGGEHHLGIAGHLQMACAATAIGDADPAQLNVILG